MAVLNTVDDDGVMDDVMKQLEKGFAFDPNTASFNDKFAYVGASSPNTFGGDLLNRVTTLEDASSSSSTNMASTEDLTSAVGAIDEKLATKATVTAVDAKADKSYVDGELAAKASTDQFDAMQTKIDDLIEKLEKIEAANAAQNQTMAAQDRRIKDLEGEKQKAAKQASNRAALIQAVQDSLAVVDAKASVEMPAHEAGEPVPGARANFQLTCGGDVMFDAPEGKQVVFGQSEESVMVAIDPAQGNVNIHGKVRTKGCADGVCEKVTELVSVFNTLLEALKE